MLSSPTGTFTEEDGNIPSPSLSFAPLTGVMNIVHQSILLNLESGNIFGAHVSGSNAPRLRGSKAPSLQFASPRMSDEC